MKIQLLPNHGLQFETDKKKFAHNPSSSIEADFAIYSKPEAAQTYSTGKNLDLPGEYEIREILVSSFYSEARSNLVFKVVTEDLAIIHFGNLTEAPLSDLFEKLGENIDVIIITISENFDAKKAKALIEKIDPRMAILIGETAQTAPIKEMMTVTPSESPFELKRSNLSEDKTEVVVLN